MLSLKFLKVDFVIQTLFFILLFSALFYSLISIRSSEIGLIIAAFLALPIGLWQVISAVVGTIKGTFWRGIYLVVVLIYFFILGLNVNQMNKVFNNPFLVVLLIGIPAVLSIFYYVKTYQERKVRLVKPLPMDLKDDDDLLDVGF